jgi:hypothetical protein
MDLESARSLLNEELELLKFHSYSYFRARIGEVWTKEIVAPDGKTYQLEFEAGWDSRPAVNIRVAGLIDDSRWRALLPLTNSFILSPSGEFAGESRAG